MGSKGHEIRELFEGEHIGRGIPTLLHFGTNVLRTPSSKDMPKMFHVEHQNQPSSEGHSLSLRDGA